MESFLDTFLNVWTFGFIAVLLWLYLRKEPQRGND